MARSRDVQEDDVGARPPRSSVPSAPSAPAGANTLPAPAPPQCEALFELFRGGAGSVHLGRLQEGNKATQLVALRRLANLPTRELEAAMALAQSVAHPRLAKVLGTYQHEDSWYLASEYASGVTLFELGQAAVRQRTPVAPPVAVRIMLDALTVTAEAEQLLGGNVGGARCLYPESVWISDSGKIFMSEIVVAPVLARITTGASYVAVTTGMSAQAADVRAAAVELARLACGRLMNGNPASWQTRELPSELTEVLARAIHAGEGTETLAAFANALSALGPGLIAEREAVQAEVERLMGPERLRRREQLESLQEHPSETDTTRVFRAAPAPAVPSFGEASPSGFPPDLAAARRARASTVPPPKPKPVGSRPTNPTPTIPALPPTPAPAPEPADEASDSPISGVWREAHERLGELNRLTRRRAQSGENQAITPAAKPAPPATTPEAPSQARFIPKRSLFVLLIAVALSALVGGAWLVQSSMRNNSGAPQHVR